MSDRRDSAGSGDLIWEIAIPLLSNRSVVGGLVRLFVVTGTFTGVLMAVLLASQGDWDLILPVGVGLVLACIGLFLLCLAAMAALLRDRMRFRFAISANGVSAENLDGVPALRNLLDPRAPRRSGGPRTAPVGGESGADVQEALWSGSFQARFDDRAHVIVLRNPWRGLLHVYCTPEVYPAAVARVRDEIATHGTAQRAAQRSLLAWLRGRPAAVADKPVSDSEVSDTEE